MIKLCEITESDCLYAELPAKIWEESFPLGNGTLGANIYGNPECETITLNHDCLWSGYPRNHKEFRSDYESYAKARNLIREKKYVEAEKEITSNFTGYGSEAYMPMGRLKIDFLNNENFQDYSRILDFKTAICKTNFKISGEETEITSFISHSDKAFVTKINSGKRKISFVIKLESDLYSRTWCKNSTLFLEGECPCTSEQNILNTERKDLYFDENEKRCTRFITAVKIVSDGKISYHGNEIIVNGATRNVIYLTCETSFNGFDKHPFLEGKDYKSLCLNMIESVSSKEFDEILSDHLKDYVPYYNRVSLDLGSENRCEIPTSKRLSSAFNDGVNDPALITLLFNYGRYLTIAGSREGSEAMNLQGIWNPLFFPPWHSNYTVNINTEMNYFGTLGVNLKEMYEPLIRFVKELSVNGKITAEKLYHAKGWVCHHNSDIWRTTQPVGGHAIYSFWSLSSGWLCHHLFEYFEFTNDYEYLKNTAFPLMCGAADFYLSQLETLPCGKRGLFPSTSPENRYLCENGQSPISETTEMSMAIIRELFGNIIKSSEILGIENQTVMDIKKELPNLYQTQIGKDGRILEWYGEHPEAEIHHRHISHLYGLHPAHEISPQLTPKLAKAAAKVLEVRGDESTGWSIAWKSNCFARLHDGNHALKLLKLQLRPCLDNRISVKGGGGTFPNMFCAHPPFQIDGNFGAMSAIYEMLLQSSSDTVSILPACPDEWTDISVCGLSARGNRTISYTVQNGHLTNLKIVGSKPAKVYFKNTAISDTSVIEYIFTDSQRV